MLVYIYCAALLCEGCGDKCKADLIAKGEAPEDPDDENSFDSDDFPKGPQEEGESDSPSYCDHCKCFLETMLTSMGRDYVEEAVNNYYNSKPRRGNGEVISEWMEFYDIPNPNDMITCSVCKKPTKAEDAHLHQGEYIGDDCCWDERLRSTE